MQTQARAQSPCFQDVTEETLEEVQDALDIIAAALLSDVPPTEALSRLASRACRGVIQVRADVAATRH